MIKRSLPCNGIEQKNVWPEPSVCDLLSRCAPRGSSRRGTSPVHTEVDYVRSVDIRPHAGGVSIRRLDK